MKGLSHDFRYEVVRFRQYVERGVLPNVSILSIASEVNMELIEVVTVLALLSVGCEFCCLTYSVACAYKFKVILIQLFSAQLCPR